MLKSRPKKEESEDFIWVKDSEKNLVKFLGLAPPPKLSDSQVNIQDKEIL